MPTMDDCGDCMCKTPSRSYNLYRVKVRGSYEGKPQSYHEFVLATDAHTALDIVKRSLRDDQSLYDEEIQRAIVDDDIREHRVDRKYGDYINEVDMLRQR